MHEDEKPLEEELRQGLARLADEAGAGPSAGDVMQRRRRRTVSRRLAAGTAAAAAVVIAAILVSPWRTAERAPMAGREDKPVRGIIVQARLSPLPVDAGAGEIEAVIQEYLVSVGVRGGAVVTKDAAGDLSFALSGEVAVSLEQVRADLAALLRNYETASIERRVDTLRYVLVASRAMKIKTSVST